jgi:dUTP pyrophosphatase
MSFTPSHHEPPSLPASPLPKRTKVIDPTPLTQAHSLPHAAADDSGTATPTPLMSLHTPVPIAPSVAAAAGAEQALQVQLLSDKAKAPTKGSAYAAGHDLYSARDVVIPKWGRARVDTDISVAVPAGTCMCIPRLEWVYGRVC